MCRHGRIRDNPHPRVCPRRRHQAMDMVPAAPGGVVEDQHPAREPESNAAERRCNTHPI